MNEIEEALEKAMPSIARRLLNELVVICPVDTGRLKNSLKVIPTDKGLLIWMVDYGMFVEFGTLNQRPNPFVRNTIQTKLATIIKEEIMKV